MILCRPYPNSSSPPPPFSLPELLVLEKEYKTSSAALALQRRRLQQQEKTFGKSDSGFLDRSLSSSREQDSSTPLFAATFSSPSTHSSSTTAAAAAATRAEWIKVKTPAQIPANVDPAGYDVLGQPLFIARAEYQNGLVLGKVGRHTNGILIACSKSLQEKCLVGFEFEVLKSLEGMSWVSIEAYQRRSRNLMDDDGSDGLWTLPDGAVYGGYDTSGTLFYVCRAVSFQSKRGSSPPPPPPTLSKKKSSFRLSLMYGLNSVMGVGSSATSTTATHTRSRSNSDEKVTTLVPGRCSESRLGATITAGSKMEEGVFPFEVLILNY